MLETKPSLITSTDIKIAALMEQRDAFKEMLQEGYKPALLAFGIWLQEHGFVKGENMQGIVDKFIKTKQFL